jgi:hypothetical protein
MSRIFDDFATLDTARWLEIAATRGWQSSDSPGPGW